MSEHKELVVINQKPQLPMVVEESGLHGYLEQIKKFPVLTEEEDNVPSSPGGKNSFNLPPVRTADVGCHIRGKYRSDAGREKV